MCGIKLKSISFLVLSLFFLSSFSSLSAMDQETIKSNLTVSSQLLTTLDLQLQSLETELDNKNQSLTNLQNVNLSLNQQLENLDLQLTSLTETNKQLMDLSDRLELQLSNSQTQLTSLSEELRKQESSKFWGIVGGVLGGLAVGIVGTWAVMTYM